jgi:signal transduction histidine kinase
MIGLWKKSLATQLICFTLAALIISQGLTFLISWKDHSKALDTAAKSEFFSRARTMTRLMGTVPPEFRQQALLASETRNSRFWLTDQEAADAPTWRLQAVAAFSRQLENYVDFTQIFGGAPSTPQLPDAAKVAAANLDEGWRTPAQRIWALPQPVRYIYFDGSRGYGLIIRLDDGRWLNAAFYLTETGSWWTSTSLASLMLTAFILALIGVLIASRIARPLRNLAVSAEAFGRGENLPPLSEDGPDEIRRTAESFNKMQSRLHRFVEDRTKMLAAIGHDLRTPLTSLRLRAEFVNNKDIQRKMLATIDELQAMTEAAIAFARGESTEEETRAIELEALVGSICDDQADLGHPVTYVEGAKMNYRCRPDGLRRAVRNLVENAVRYGGDAKVYIRHTASTIDIVVEDRGPGIPDEMREKVFAPFFRLETSRNRDTGGIGLGLSIARAVARQHGGDISFSHSNTGMQAVISLPLEGKAEPAPARKTHFWSFQKPIRVSQAIRLPQRVAPPPPRSS